MSKYQDVLQSWLYKTQEQDIPLDTYIAIERALRIADVLSDGISTNAVREGFKVLEANYDCITGDHMGIQGLERAFEAIVETALKELSK